MIRYQKHKWMGHVLWHYGILHDILGGSMLGKSTRERRQIQLVDDLLETKELCRSEESSQRVLSYTGFYTFLSTVVYKVLSHNTYST